MTVYQQDATSEYDYVSPLLCEPGWLPRFLETGIYPGFLHHEKATELLIAVTWLYKTKQAISLDNLADQLSWQQEFAQANASATALGNPNKVLRELLQDTVSDKGMSPMQLERNMAATILEVSRQLLKPETKKHLQAAGSLFRSLQQPSFMNTLSTGFDSLDKATRGMQPGSMWMLASAPSVGCTAFALNLCEHMLRQKKQVIIVSLKHNKQEMASRLLSKHAGVPFGKMLVQPAYLTVQEKAKLYRAYETLPLEYCTINDTCFDAYEALIAYLHEAIPARQATLVLVDGWNWAYKTPAADFRLLNARLLAALKHTAMETNTCVVCTASVRIERDWHDEDNEDDAGRMRQSIFTHTCNLQDLVANQISPEYCDVIAGLYRPDYYYFAQQDDEEKGKGYLQLLRNQYGPVDTIHMRPLLHLSAWKEWNETEAPGDEKFDEDAFI